MIEKVREAVDLHGRVAIVTGAGSGIGRALALTFAAAGARVLVNDILPERAEQTVTEIADRGGDALAGIGDVSVVGDVDMFVEACAAQWGRIDILCNNAGIMDRVHLPAETPIDLWERVMAVNSTGVFLVSRAVLPHMLRQRSGVILNTASVAGLRGGSGGIAYTASKHAVIGISRSIAWMHGPDGIRCNAICPGPVNTDILPGGFASIDQRGLARLQPIGALAGHATEPQSIADLALFLASDAAGYVNGAIVTCDGGWMSG